MGFLYSQFFITPPYPSKSFDGQTVIVTGSNVGLGKEAARHISRLGAKKIIIAVRNTKAGEDAKKEILSTTKRSADTIEVWELDLASHKSVKAFADRALKLERIDVLLENAAMIAQSLTVLEDSGYERSVTVNVINTVYLALLLLPKLKETAKKFNTKPRVTFVVSEVHGWTKMPEWEAPNTFEALNNTSKKDFGRRYPDTKLLEVLVVKQISPMLVGSGVIVNMLNPGLCHSELGRDAGFFFYLFKLIVARTTEVGGRTLVASAAAGEESHGAYMSDSKVENESLSPFVRSDDGKKASEKIWHELKVILEKVDPGVTNNV